MLNVERIRTMTKLSRYEVGPNSEYLKLNQMYRSDYIGMALLRNFFCITVGYLFAVGLGCLYHFDFLANNWFKVDLAAVITRIVVIYLSLLIGYSVFVYIRCSVKYKKMQVYIKEYAQELHNLETQYENPVKNDENSYDDWRNEG